MTISCSRAALMRFGGTTLMTAAILTAGLSAPAQAAASPGDRSVSYRVVNDSDLRMRLTDSDVNEGVWTRKPTKLIKPDKSGAFASESSEDRGGTGGSVTYTTLEGDIVISWDNGWVDDSEFDCEAPSNLTCQVDGDVADAPHPSITATIS